MLLGCEPLTPAWSPTHQVNEVNPFPDATCEDICDLQGSLCLERSCTGATLLVQEPFISELVPSGCDDTIESVVGDGPTWDAEISCCCGS